MPLDARVARFLKLLQASQPVSMDTVSAAARRESLTALMAFAGPGAPVARIDLREVPGPAGPLAVRVYTPLEAPAGPLPGLVYFHGGGLVAGSSATHEPIARELARAALCRVVSVDYRLAPEHAFPAAVDDALAAVRFTAAHAAEFDIDPERLIVCGDSAGATLAAVTCQSLAATGDCTPALQVLLCPILDYSRSTASKEALASGYLVDAATLAHDVAHYVPPGMDLADPRISPLRAASLTGLPRTVVHTAEFDPLRDEGAAYVERLRAAGVAVTHTCHDGMIHLFYGLGSVIPYARRFFEDLGRDIRGTWVT